MMTAATSDMTMLGGFFLVLLSQSPAVAQERGPAGPAPVLAPDTVKLGSFDLSIYWRTRAEHWTWFEGDSGDGHYPFWHSQLRVAVGQTRRRVDWLVEAEHVGLLDLPNDAIAAAPLGQLGLGATYYAANGNRRNVAGAPSVFLLARHIQ